MKLNEVTLYENKSHRILKEGWQDLTESQQNLQLRFERELFPLVEQYSKLAEATLTKDQVLALFKGAEETAMASGDNTSVAGKIGKGALAAAKLPVDVAKAVDAKVNELGRMAQKAGPIKNADQKFEQLKKDIKAKNSDSKIVQGIEKVSEWAKANPGKASLAVGILTTIAAFAGGPAGGAAAGLVLRASKDLLQGEKLSSAVGGSLKVAAYGALAGMAFKELTDNMVDNIATAENAEWDAMEAAMKKENYIAMKADVMGELGVAPDALEGTYKVTINGNLNRFYYNYETVIPKDQLGALNAAEQAMSGLKITDDAYYVAAGKYHDLMATIQNSTEAKNLTAAFEAIKDIPKDSLTAGNLRELLANAADGDELIDAIKNAGGGLGAVVQGALATVDDKADKSQTAKPIDPEEKKQLELGLKGGSDATPVDKNFDKSQKLSDFGAVGDKAEAQDMLAKLELYLAEADPAQGELGLDNPNTAGAKAKRGLGNLAGKVGGAFKGAASKAKGAVAGAAGKAVGAVKQGAKDLGNKVTANKLMKAWKAAGEPLDTGSIMNLMQDAGLSNDQIGQIGQAQKIKLDPPANPKADEPQQGQSDTPQADTPQQGQSDTPQADTPQQGQADTPAPAGQADTPAPAGQKGKVIPMTKGTTAKRNPKIKVAKGAGQMAKAKDGQDYVWAGAQWINNTTGKMAAKDVAGQLGNPVLTDLAAKIKKAGPEVVALVIKQLGDEQKLAASIDREVDDLISELDKVLH